MRRVVVFLGTTGGSRNPAASIHQITNPNPTSINPIIPAARGVSQCAVEDLPAIPTNRHARQAAPNAINIRDGFTGIAHGTRLALLARGVYVRLLAGRVLVERLDGDVRLIAAVRFRFLKPAPPQYPSLLCQSGGQTHTPPLQFRQIHRPGVQPTASSGVPVNQLE